MQKLIFLLLTIVHSLPRNLKTITWINNKVKVERNIIINLQCQNTPQKSQNITTFTEIRNLDIKVVRNPISNIKDDFQIYLMLNDSISIKNLLMLGFDINSIDSNGMTPLHNAININSKNMAAILLDYGANIDSRDSNNLTPLHHAIINKNIDIVYYLIQNRANVGVKSDDNESLLHFTVKHVKGSNTQVILATFLINAGLSTEDVNNHEETVLHLAVGSECNIELVKLLLTVGANPHKHDKNGNNCYDIALKYGHKECTEILEEYTQDSRKSEDKISFEY